jgi:hypothetical protein
MRIGIIGLPQTGKKTLFSLLTGERDLIDRFDQTKPLSGIAEVQDPRFDRLVAIYDPKKQVRSRLEITLVPKIEEETLSTGKIFREMADVEAFCHVVRAFEDDRVYHVRGSVDPGRDIDYVAGELVLHDLLFVEKRLERIEKDMKKMKDEKAAREKTLLLKLREHLEKETPLRLFDFSPDENRIVASYPFLTRKAMIVILNISEEQIPVAEALSELASRRKDAGVHVLPLAVKTEAEISSLDSEEERREFMAAVGIEESALSILTRMSIEALGLVSFFTVGRDEVRQWFVKKGATAAKAAGVIHSDMERGFIRAEVMKFEDLVESGSEEKVKTAGKLLLKGKDYVVEDGDILTIRFSV